MTPEPYGWLARFWDDIIATRAGRHWLIATLHDGHTWLRDPLAWSEIRHVLRPRVDMAYEYVRAWSTEQARHYPNTDVFMIGRPRCYASSRLAHHAHCLESKAVASFHDTPRGSLGRTVSYAGLQFRQHEIEASPEYPPRCDIDFGLLLYREDEVDGELCRLVAIAGVGQLATALLTRILTNDALRMDLMSQAADIAPRPPHTPEEHTEICVRFEIQEGDAEDFLDHGRFTFRVEVVAFGKGIVFTRRTEPELILAPYAAPDRGGVVRTDLGELRLSRERFLLLRRLVEAPEAATTPELCRYLAATAGDGSSTVPAGRLAKLVHDLNDSLREVSGIERTVRFSKKSEEKRYVLAGVRASVSPTVHGAPPVPPSRVRRSPPRSGRP